jgi:RNA polymerase sigma factor (sigma-70 family)
MAHVDQMCSEENAANKDGRERARLAAEVFHRYGREIRAMVQFSIPDQAEAEDVFQNLFLSLLAKPLPADIRSIKRYLYKAIVNDAISHARRVQCRMKHTRVYAIRQKRTLEVEGPQDAMIRAEQAQEVVQLTHCLRPAEARAVYSQFGLDCDLDRDKVAEDLGIKRRSFAKNLWRGIRRLRLMAVAREGRDV